MLLTALPAEEDGIQACIWIGRMKDLALQHHAALCGWLKRRVGVPGARDEPMELERQKRAIAWAAAKVFAVYVASSASGTFSAIFIARSPHVVGCP